MKISNIRMRETSQTISLLADCKIRPVGLDTIYFTFDKKYRDFLYEDASPFAAALLIPCMYLHEDLIIEGIISEQLYHGMLKIMETALTWWPQMKRIKIKSTAIAKDAATAKNVATFFSAGVDSFYTYLKHRKDVADPISHFIFINGTDISLDNKELWEDAKQNIQNIADACGIQLVSLETNLQSLLEPMVSPNFTHGGALAAVGLCLRQGFKKIYIPASFGEEQIVPYGSHPDIDKYWSTETIAFEHDGTEASRFHKIERQIIKSPIALGHLRVCYMNKKGVYNCGECEKCLRTMIALYALGKLNEAKTFPHTLDLKNVSKTVAREGLDAIGHRQNLAALKERNIDPALQREIEIGIANVWDPSHGIIDRLFKGFVYFDHRYFRGKLYKLYMASGIVRHY